jgi:cytoskeletal protein CcmA (bactofilin family)
MNSYAAIALLIIASAALFVLPLVPAIAELQHKSDAQPLSVIQQHTGEIRHFADSFRVYIQALQPAMHQAVSTGATASGTLPDSTEYLVLGTSKETLRLPLRQSDETCPVLLAAAIDLSLPPDTAFSKDIYVGGRFLGGTRNTYRAILGEKEVQLGAESRVMRWVHAVGDFSAGPACHFHGRVSSNSGIRLHRDCTFQRLNAPCIELGNQSTLKLNSPANPTIVSKPTRLLHDGNFQIAPGEVFHGNLVARGELRIGSGAQVWGSVKGDRGVVVESGAQLHGSLISASTMRIGPDCSIHGPIIAEKLLTLEAGTCCGSADAPTTVSAPWIHVAEGVTVFGTLWAREHGEVMEKL